MVRLRRPRYPRAWLLLSRCWSTDRLPQTPSMFWFVLLGLALGALALLVPLARTRREADRVEQENQKLAQDRQRLIDFMYLMTEALGEGLSRQELHQRIVHASILCTGALSACIFEKTDRDTMRGVA